MEEYKVLITTSGIGSRLGELTNYTNKALIRVGKKPAISYIVEKYPDDIELVITLGYFGSHVKDFLLLAYPNKNFKFVNVNHYCGQGSSLGYSLLMAKDELQCPFIFHASDTIILNEKIPLPYKNWMGYTHKNDPSQYRTITLGSFTISTIQEKGYLHSNNTYIGLSGINDYKLFWETLENEYGKDQNNSNLSDCDGLRELVEKKIIYPIEFNNWFDIGNSTELKKTRELIPDKFEILDKVDESIFLFDNFVIKFFHNKEVCSNRVKRAKVLGEITPKILDYKDNFYKYEYATGSLFSDSVNEVKFEKFLQWCKDNLWKHKEYDGDFNKLCGNFYIDKTFDRVKKYLNGKEDTEKIINGFQVPDILTLLNELDFEWLCDGIPSNFHGDLVIDNVIETGDNEFKLIDIRQDFAGSIEVGDLNYDLSKINHNMILNHSIINKKLYKIDIKDDNITCDILCSKELIECQRILHEFIKINEYDLLKVKVLTSLIWINMAPLHEYPLNDFLFNFGKLNLYKNIK